MIALKNLWCPAANSRIVGKLEVILGRRLLAGESEFSWEIPALRVKHRIAVRPNPVKSSAMKMALTSTENKQFAAQNDAGRIFMLVVRQGRMESYRNVAPEPN